MTPNGWTRTVLGEIAEIVGGGTPSRSVPSYWGGEIPWATPTDITGLDGRFISRTGSSLSQEGLSASSAKVLPPGSVLMTSRATIGACAINTIPMATNQGFQNLIPSDNVNAGFLLYLVQFLRPELTRLAAGSTFIEISKGSVRNVSIALPPLGEQRRIAAILSSVDDVVQRCEAVAAGLVELKKALLTHFLADGRGPEHWPNRPLRELFEVQLGKMLSPRAKTGATPLPYLRNANVQWGRVLVDDVSEMDFSETERAKFRLRRGDLLVCEGGEIGRSAIWNDELPECYFQKALHRLRPRTPDVLPEFLHYYLMFEFQIQGSFSGERGQTTIAHLPKERLEGLPVPTPRRDEQIRIVESLKAVDAAFASGQEELDQRRRVAVALRAALLSGEVRTLLAEAVP